MAGAHAEGERDQSSKLIDSVCDDFRSAIAEGSDIRIESYLDTVPDSERTTLLLKLISVEIASQQGSGKQISLESYLQRFPGTREQIQKQFFVSSGSAVALDETIDTPRSGSGSLDHAVTTDATVEGARRYIDRYLVVATLGRGGFGEVFQAHDPVLDRDVAVKLHHSRFASDSHSTELLLNEGRRIAQLNHEGIVRVLDAGLDNGSFYLISEFMPSGTLQQRLAKGKVSQDDAVSYAIRLADALHHAHLRGFVHRDIKPANILFDETDRPCLADFGLSASEEELTQERPVTVGTVGYMSPEQARGTSNLVDPRSDIYSLGLVLYRMLTGRLPFKGDSVDDIREQIASREPRPLRLIDGSIPKSLEAICLKCLDTSITQRYTTAWDFKEALEQWRDSAAEPPPRTRVRNIAFVMTGLLIAVVAFLLWDSSFFSSSDAGDPPAVPTSQQPSLSNPKVVVWHPYDGHDKHGYDAEQRHYYMDAFGISLFQVGEQPPGALRLKNVFSVSRWKGLAGVFWQRNPNTKYSSRCRAIKVGRYREDQPFVVEICEFSVGVYSGAQEVVISESVLKTLKPDFQPTTERAYLEVSVDGSKLTSVRLNSKELLKQPFQFAALEGEVEGSRGYGFLGQAGRVHTHELISE